MTHGEGEDTQTNKTSIKLRTCEIDTKIKSCLIASVRTKNMN